METDKPNMDNENTPQETSNINSFRMERHCSRILALQFLFQLDCNQTWDYDTEQLQDFFDQLNSLEDLLYPQKVIAKAWRYAKKLIAGVIEKHESIDEMIQNCANNWQMDRMGGVDRCLMRISIYEMLNMKRITPGISINEAVDIAKEFGIKNSPRFINGVLDQIYKNYKNKTESDNGNI